MTDNYGFQDPTQPGMFKAEDWTNHLLLIEPHRYLENQQTKHGPADAVEARITVLSVQPPHVIEQARVWGTRLVSTLRAALGGLPVLGRLNQELTSGGNAMWVLGPTSPEDKAFAHSYLTSRPATQAPAQPQAPAAPAVPPAYPQAAPQHAPAYPQAAPQHAPAYPQAAPQHAPAYPQAAPQYAPAYPQAAPQYAPTTTPAPTPPAPAAAPVPQPQPVPQPVPSPTTAPAAPAGALTPEQIAAMPPEVQRLLLGQQQQQG